MAGTRWPQGLAYNSGGLHSTSSPVSIQQRRPPLYLLSNGGCSHPHPLPGEGRWRRKKNKNSLIRPLRPKSLIRTLCISVCPIHSRLTHGNCPPLRQPSKPGLAHCPTATAPGLTTGKGRMVVRCRKKAQGERKWCPHTLRHAHRVCLLLIVMHRCHGGRVRLTTPARHALTQNVWLGQHPARPSAVCVGGIPKQQNFPPEFVGVVASGPVGQVEILGLMRVYLTCL